MDNLQDEDLDDDDTDITLNKRRISSRINLQKARLAKEQFQEMKKEYLEKNPPQIPFTLEYLQGLSPEDRKKEIIGESASLEDYLNSMTSSQISQIKDKNAVCFLFSLRRCLAKMTHLDKKIARREKEIEKRDEIIAKLKSLLSQAIINL